MTVAVRTAVYDNMGLSALSLIENPGKKIAVVGKDFVAHRAFPLYSGLRRRKTGRTAVDITELIVFRSGGSKYF